MKSFAVAALLGATSAYQTLEAGDLEFMRFVAEHGKSYGTKEEFEFRLATFKENFKFIQEFNAANNTHKVGINFMADLTHEERKKNNKLAYNPAKGKTPKHLTGHIPEEVNWENEGDVSSVNDQGQCGSCWAFSAVEAVESLHAISTGELVKLSEQQMIDCDSYDMGCGGGLMENAFKYIADNGLMSAADYPYTGYQGSCQYDESKVVANISGWETVAASVDQVELAAVNQPLSVSIEADQAAFQFYTSGVITAGCGENLDHGVLLVGFSNEKIEGCDKVGILRNSWGANWGANGDVKVCFDTDQCGVMNDVSYPTL